MKKSAILTVTMLMSMVPGATLSIIMDRVVYAQAVANLGHSAFELPGFAIPFSGSYLVGLLIGFLIVVVKTQFFESAFWGVIKNQLILWDGVIQSRLLAITREFLKSKKWGRELLLLAFFVAVYLFFQYLISGLSALNVGLGLLPAFFADRIMHSWRNLNNDVSEE